jgi:hypothetical protein
MKKMIYSVACVVALASVAEAQQKTSPVAIAEGWVQDNSRNAAQLARESFIKADEVGEIGNGIIYLREVGLDEELTSLKDVVDLDAKMFTLNKTTVQVKDAGKIVLADKKTTSVVKHITGSSDAQFQAIAYIPEKGSVVTLTLATYSKEFFEDHLNDFNKMVSTYSKDVRLTPIVSESNLD